MDNNFQRAKALIKSGDKKRGGQLLTEIVRKDPRNVNAWLWLSSCVNIDEQKVYCLKRVLEIDPNHNVALAALSKLQQPEQPSEKEILGNPEPRPKSVSNVQVRQIPSSSSNINAKSSAFQPKYLTAVAGMIIMAGTAFPWAARVYGQTKLEEYSGLTQAPGILTAVVGLAIIFVSIFQKTKPGKANSLVSSLLALVTFLMACLWVLTLQEVCFEAFFGGACYKTEIGTGFGYGLSMVSLFLAFVFGLIPNPKEKE